MDKIVSGNNTIYLNKKGKISILSAKLRKYIMSDDRASYEVISDQPIPLKINDTIDIFGQTYRLNKKPNEIKLSENSYKYNIEFEGKMWDLLRCQYFNTDGTGFKTTTDFSLIGTIEVFLVCLINNIKRFDINWELGTFTNGETKTITFSQDTCLSALQKICDEFKVEFRIDEANGKSIVNTGNFGKSLNYSFEYGKGKGLYSLEINNVSDTGIINRLYVSGGSDNLPNGYRNFSSNLKLPNAEYLEDSASIAKIGLKEGAISFPDIYPHRTGKIMALGATKFIFDDSTMDFDLNAKEADNVTTKYLIPGTSAKIHFNTGNLAGYEFEIKKYVHSSKTFEIIPFTNETGQTFPDINSAAFQFAVNDEYVILDIFAPEIYITNAEEKLLESALPEFEKLKNIKVNYKLDVDPEFLKNKIIDGENPFNVGDKIHIKDDKLNIDREISIVGFSRDLINPLKYDIEVADSYEIAYSSQIALQVAGINNEITYQQQQQSLNNLNGYRRLNELKDFIFDSSGTEITPRIETMLLAIGNISQQYQLTGVTIVPNYLDEPNDIAFSAGTLTHYGISDTPIEWDFTSFVQTGLDSAKVYYVYSKCQKSGIQGEWVVTEEKIIYDSDPNYYYFIVGALHKVKDDNRAYSPLDGFSLFNGRYITTGKIQSVNQKTWYDLDLGAFLLNNQAGMTGNGAVSDIFLWAGSDYDNRANAPFGITREGLIFFRNSSGIKVFELGLKNDKVVFNIYDETTGLLVATIGDQGIIFQGYIPESYNLTKLQFSTYQNDFDVSQRRNAALSNTTVLFDLGGGNYKHELQGSISEDYQYTAGYNFESAMNAQYEGKIFETQNKLGSTVADGWYNVYFNNIIPQTATVYITVVLYKIVNGLIVELDYANETKDWNQFIIM